MPVAGFENHAHISVLVVEATRYTNPLKAKFRAKRLAAEGAPFYRVKLCTIN